MALYGRGVQCCFTSIVHRNYPFHGLAVSTTSKSKLSFSTIRFYSLPQARSGLFQRANEKYNRVLQHRFPKLYVLYQTFMKGFQLLLEEIREIRRIKIKMLSKKIPLRCLPYREMNTVMMFRKDMIKAIPLVLISLPPFAIVLVLTLMYLFPRQLLIRHLWTPQQQREFDNLYHEQRTQHCQEIVKGMARTIPHVKEWTLRLHLLNFCSKVQIGSHPCVFDIKTVRDVFSGNPLGIGAMDSRHIRLLSAQLFLTPWLPGFLVRRRLKARALDLLYLDRALDTLGQDQLTDTEIHQACYLRGLNPCGLSSEQCREWLLQWTQLSTQLKESEISALLHSIVLLSVNYPRP